MDNLAEFMQLCRLCLVKDQVNVPIFEEQGDIRQIFLKITACLPVKVSKDDSLPKKICDGCLYKLELLYQFWNTTANAEKQLLSWLSQAGMEADSKTTQEAVAIALQTQVATHSVKEEEIDPPESTPESTDDLTTEAESFIMQPPQLPFEPAGAQFEEPSEFNESQEQSHASDDNGAQNDDSQDADDVEPPPPKRSRRQAAIKAAQLVARKDEDDDEDDEEEEDEDDVDDPSVEATVPKTEEESEDEMDESGTNPEPTDFVSLGTADEEQPGPSGVGKVDSEAPLPPSTAAKPKRIPKKWKEDDVKRTYTCEICSMSASLTKTEINAHYKTHGNRLGLLKYRRRPPKPHQIFVCEICSTKFASEEDLHEHVMKHEDQYKCEVCQKGFKMIMDYTMHMQSHSDDKLYECPLCDYSTPNAYKIRSHVLVKHKMVKNYECPVEGCKASFMWFPDFQEHKYYHTGERPFVCEICGSSFMYTRYLNVHKKVIHGDWRTTCRICSTVCVGQQNYRKHLALHTKSEWVCATCGKTFKKREGLKLHEMRHAGYKAHKCRHCDKAFVQKNTMIEHERTHTGDRPYSCEHCDKKFTQRSSLVRHVRGHTGEKPYTCHFCNKGYTTRATLTTHLKSCNGPRE